MDLSKQNILFFTRAMGYGGAEKIVIQMCKALRPFVQSITVVSGIGAKAQILDSIGIKFYEIPDFENKSPKVILKIRSELLKIIKEEHITIIHTHQRMAAFYIAALGLYRKCVFINTSHNTFHDKRLLTTFAYRNAHLIACGKKVKKNLVDTYHLPDNRITVIRNAIMPFEEEIIPDPELSKFRQNNFFLIGNIGRLAEQKGMEYFLQAIPIISNRYPKTRFLIIGNGEKKYEEKLKSLTRQLGICEYVKFMGYREDIQNLMSQMDLIVLSSLWEGMPLTPLEAFSVKKTIVATAVDGTVEIVRNGENGYLIPPRDSKAIAEKVLDLIEHTDRKHTMEENGYHTFLSNFSFDAFSQKVLDYYRSL